MKGEVVRHISKRRRSDGSLVDVRILGVPLIVNGKQTGTFGIYEDITERGRAEEAQHKAEEKYRRIFESAVEGFFESTPEGRFVTVNPAMARIAGYSSPAEMIREVYDIGKQLYVDPEIRNELKRGLEERGLLEAFECPMLRRDGSTIWISMNVRAIRDASGKIVSHDGTAEDITERKRSELIRQVTTEIIRAVSVTDNLDALLRLIHASLGKVLDASNCFVALRDAASGKFHFPFFVDRYDAAPAPDEMEDLDRSCTAYVFRTGEAMLISKARFDQLASKGEVELVGTPCPSWLGVPLRTPAETIGVLGRPKLRARECLHLARPGISVFRRRTDRAGDRTEALGRARAGKRSSPARPDRTVARRALDRGQESPLHFRRRIGACAAGSEAESDRGDVAPRLFRDKRSVVYADRRASSGRGRRSRDVSSGMEKRLLRLSRRTFARRRRGSAGRDLHGARRHRPQATGRAVPPGSEDGSRRASRRWNRARLQ